MIFYRSMCYLFKFYFQRAGKGTCKVMSLKKAGFIKSQKTKGGCIRGIYPMASQNLRIKLVSCQSYDIESSELSLVLVLAHTLKRKARSVGGSGFTQGKKK